MFGNVLLRREQYRISDNPERVQPICHSIILGKVHNQRQVIRRYLRDYKAQLDTPIINSLEAAQQRLGYGLNKILATQNLPDLLGREGEMASVYFGVFPHLIRNPDFHFPKRTRNPPTEAVNALLSFTYTLMTQTVHFRINDVFKLCSECCPFSRIDLDLKHGVLHPLTIV